jgi:chromosome partitioning protein
VALLKVGQRLATIDLDSRQKSFSRYIENRRAWIERAGIEIADPLSDCTCRWGKARGQRGR